MDGTNRIETITDAVVKVAYLPGLIHSLDIYEYADGSRVTVTDPRGNFGIIPTAKKIGNIMTFVEDEEADVVTVMETLGNKTLAANVQRSEIRLRIYG